MVGNNNTYMPHGISNDAKFKIYFIFLSRTIGKWALQWECETRRTISVWLSTVSQYLSWHLSADPRMTSEWPQNTNDPISPYRRAYRWDPAPRRPAPLTAWTPAIVTWWFVTSVATRPAPTSARPPIRRATAPADRSCSASSVSTSVREII